MKYLARLFLAAVILLASGNAFAKPTFDVKKTLVEVLNYLEVVKQYKHNKAITDDAEVLCQISGSLECSKQCNQIMKCAKKALSKGYKDSKNSDDFAGGIMQAISGCTGDVDVSACMESSLSGSEIPSKGEIKDFLAACLAEEVNKVDWRPSATTLSMTEMAPVVPDEVHTVLTSEGATIDEIRAELDKILFVNLENDSPSEEDLLDFERVQERQNQFLLNSLTQAAADAEKSLDLTVTAREEISELRGEIEKQENFVMMLKWMGGISARSLQKNNEIAGLYAKMLEVETTRNVISGTPLKPPECEEGGCMGEVDVIRD